MNVTILDSNSNQLIYDCSVTLKDSLEEVIMSDSSLTETGKGTANFTIWYGTPGKKTIEAECEGIIGKLDITVYENLLDIELNSIVSFIQPKDNESPFNLNVYVKDNANLTVESQNGPYLVNLNISQESFSGKVSVETINGIANFSDLQFEGAWTITLTATSEYMIAASVTLTITNFAHSILLTIPDYLPSANFSFEIQVDVLDLYNNSVINNEPVLVAGSKIFVEISKDTL